MSKTNLEKAWDVLGNLPAPEKVNLPRYEIRMIDNTRQQGVSTYLQPSELGALLEDPKLCQAFLLGLQESVQHETTEGDSNDPEDA